MQSMTLADLFRNELDALQTVGQNCHVERRVEFSILMRWIGSSVQQDAARESDNQLPVGGSFH